MSDGKRGSLKDPGNTLRGKRRSDFSLDFVSSLRLSVPLFFPHPLATPLAQLGCYPGNSRNARMRAAPVATVGLRSSPSIDFNNLYWPSFGTRIAFQAARARSLDIETMRLFGGVMAPILTFARKWLRGYRVLRSGNRFGFVDSVRHGLWLARG